MIMLGGMIAKDYRLYNTVQLRIRASIARDFFIISEYILRNLYSGR